MVSSIQRVKTADLLQFIWSHQVYLLGFIERTTNTTGKVSSFLHSADHPIMLKDQDINNMDVAGFIDRQP